MKYLQTSVPTCSWFHVMAIIALQLAIVHSEYKKIMFSGAQCKYRHTWFIPSSNFRAHRGRIAFHTHGYLVFFFVQNHVTTTAFCRNVTVNVVVNPYFIKPKTDIPHYTFFRPVL